MSLTSTVKVMSQATASTSWAFEPYAESGSSWSDEEVQLKCIQAPVRVGFSGRIEFRLMNLMCSD